MIELALLNNNLYKTKISNHEKRNQNRQRNQTRI